MEGKKKERIEYIDLIECIAIFMVLIYHSPLYSWDFLSEYKKSYYLIYYLRTILSTGVPLFLMVNGYLLFDKKFDLRKHILKTLHLVVLTFVWAAISLLMLQVIEKQFFSVKDFFKTLLEWKIDWINHLWYMGALVCIYLFFPLLKQTYDTNIKIFICFTLISAGLTFGNTLINEVGSLTLGILMKKQLVLQDWDFFNIFNPFRGIYGYTFVYFCAGGLIKNIEGIVLSVPLLKRNIICVIGILISSLGLWNIGVFYSNLLGRLWDVVWNGYDTVFTFLNAIFIFILCMNWKQNSWFIRTVSCNTLGVYFLHMLLIYFTKAYIIEIELFCNIIGNMVYAIIILCMSLMISLILKRIPIFAKLL